MDEFKTRFPGEITVWGGTPGHPYTTTGGTGSTFNTDDTSDFLIGDRSIKINTNGTNQNTFVRKLLGPAIDMTNRVPRIWIKLTDPTKLVDGAFWLGSGGALANAYTWHFQDLSAQPYYRAGEWVSMTLPWSKAVVSGTPVRSALTDVNFQVFDGSTGALEIRWGGFSTVPDTTAKYPNGLVTFTFDDGFASTRTIAAPYLQGKGFKGTCYIIDNLDTVGSGNPTYMSIVQMQELQATYGFELGLHSGSSADHNAVGGLTSLTPEALMQSMAKVRKFIKDNGCNPSNSMAYPQGIWTPASNQALAGAGVSNARTTSFVHSETVPAGSRFRMYSRALTSTDTIANITALIDQVKANKEWLILTFHDIKAASPTGNDILTATFQGIVDYAQTAGVAVKTMAEVAGGGGQFGDTLKTSLNRLAGTTGFDEKYAANIWAGTSGLDLEGALNVRNGTTGFDTKKCLNDLAGTSGLGEADAARRIP